MDDFYIVSTAGPQSEDIPRPSSIIYPIVRTYDGSDINAFGRASSVVIEPSLNSRPISDTWTTLICGSLSRYTVCPTSKPGYRTSHVKSSTSPVPLAPGVSRMLSLPGSYGSSFESGKSVQAINYTLLSA